MVRTPFFEKNGLKKGAWSREEDERLRAYVQRYGHSNWRQVPKLAGLARCGKSCRLRWLNYLRANLKHGNYTRDEEEIIIKLQQQFGNKWSLIAENLPGRTDNEVKNYWHSHLKKSNEIKKPELKSKPRENSDLEGNSNEFHQQFEKSESPDANVSNEDFLPYILESSLAKSMETSEGDSVELSTMDSSLSKEDSVNVVPQLLSYQEFSSDFWTQPFLREDTYADDMCSGEGVPLLFSNFHADTYFLL